MKSSRRVLRVSGTVALFALAYAGAWLAYRWLAPPYARAVAHATEQAWMVLAWGKQTPSLAVVEGVVDGRPAVAMLIGRHGVDAGERRCAIAARLLFSNLPALLALIVAFPEWSPGRVRWGVRAVCWLFLFHMLAVRIEVAYLEGLGFCGIPAMTAAEGPGLLLRTTHSLSYRLAAGPEAALGLLGIAVGVSLFGLPGPRARSAPEGVEEDGQRHRVWRRLMPVDGLAIAALLGLLILLARFIPA